MTTHDGDDPIEKELLTRLASSKGKPHTNGIFLLPSVLLTRCFNSEEQLGSESTFCSARYYKPLVHPSGYGNQILSLTPHLIAAKLSR